MAAKILGVDNKCFTVWIAKGLITAARRESQRLPQQGGAPWSIERSYFRQWIIFGLDVFGRKIPLILPGGYLIGTMLLLNLVAAHIYRFQLSTKKIGIQLTHLGVILLLVGQLVTDMFSRETQMHFVEGKTKSYSESPRNYELVFTSEEIWKFMPAVAARAFR